MNVECTVVYSERVNRADADVQIKIRHTFCEGSLDSMSPAHFGLPSTAVILVVFKGFQATHTFINGERLDVIPR